MMVRWGGGTAIAAQPPIEGSLVRVERCAGFEMRGQMDRTKPSLQFSDRGRLGGETVRGDLALREQLVERLFAVDQLSAERLGSRDHSITNHGYLLDLALVKTKLLRQAEHVCRSRIPV